MEKRIRFTIILVIILIVLGAYSLQSGKKREDLVYSESLGEVVLTVDGNELTLGDVAFYVAYEEKTVQEQAIVYNPDKPNQYWNLHIDGEFVKVAAKHATLDMAVHDEIFYQMAIAENLQLTADDRGYLENEEADFWADLDDEQRESLGITEEALDKAMEKVALANKCQSVLAKMNDADYEDYNFDGEAYEALLTEHSYSENEDVWDRIDFGNITLNNY